MEREIMDGSKHWEKIKISYLRIVVRNVNGM